MYSCKTQILTGNTSTTEKKKKKQMNKIQVYEKRNWAYYLSCKIIVNQSSAGNRIF